MFRFVFWDVLPCKINFDRRFRGTCCLHHQGLKRRSTIILHGSTSQKTNLNKKNVDWKDYLQLARWVWPLNLSLPVCFNFIFPLYLYGLRVLTTASAFRKRKSSKLPCWVLIWNHGGSEDNNRKLSLETSSTTPRDYSRLCDVTQLGGTVMSAWRVEAVAWLFTVTHCMFLAEGIRLLIICLFVVYLTTLVSNLHYSAKWNEDKWIMNCKGCGIKWRWQNCKVLSHNLPGRTEENL
jgi:hypothetical protein